MLFKTVFVFCAFVVISNASFTQMSDFVSFFFKDLGTVMKTGLIDPLSNISPIRVNILGGVDVKNIVLTGITRYTTTNVQSIMTSDGKLYINTTLVLQPMNYNGKYKTSGLFSISGDVKGTLSSATIDASILMNMQDFTYSLVKFIPVVPKSGITYQFTPINIPLSSSDAETLKQALVNTVNVESTKLVNGIKTCITNITTPVTVCTPLNTM